MNRGHLQSLDADKAPVTRPARERLSGAFRRPEEDPPPFAPREDAAARLAAPNEQYLLVVAVVGERANRPLKGGLRTPAGAPVPQAPDQHQPAGGEVEAVQGPDRTDW